MQAWSLKLSTVSEMIEQWLMVQGLWQYMEAVFSGGDIVKQLPQVWYRGTHANARAVGGRLHAHTCCVAHAFHA